MVIIKENKTIFKSNENKEKRWTFVHKWLKYRLISPILWILDKILAKRLQKVNSDIPEEFWFNQINMFNKAFDSGLSIWNKTYLANKKMLPRIAWQLKLLRNIYVSILIEDTAYRELHNCIMFEQYGLMKDFYGDEPIHHVIYKSRYDGDDRYFKYVEANKLKVWHNDN